MTDQPDPLDRDARSRRRREKGRLMSGYVGKGLINCHISAHDTVGGRGNTWTKNIDSTFI
jgi:hypothetical protein